MCLSLRMILYHWYSTVIVVNRGSVFKDTYRGALARVAALLKEKVECLYLVPLYGGAILAYPVLAFLAFLLAWR